MKTFYLALDLKDDPVLIQQYEEHHRQIWPEVAQAVRASGIHEMSILRTGNRLFMVIQTTDDFSFDNKKRLDEANAKVREWEDLMWTFQQPLPHAEEGEKWMVLDEIFRL